MNSANTPTPAPISEEVERLKRLRKYHKERALYFEQASDNMRLQETYAESLDHWAIHNIIDAELSSRSQAQPVDVWQPIETAPKDGRIILGWSAGWESATAIRWVPELRWTSPRGEELVEQADWDWCGTTQCPPSHNPTHWQALPEPPK